MMRAGRMMLPVLSQAQSAALDPTRERVSFYRPSPPLDQLVEGYWVADDYIARTPRERVLPDGSQVLVVHLGASPMRMYRDENASEAIEASGAIVCGARQSPILIGTSFGPTVGVHFKPGGARPFFDASADALAEHAVALDTLWGSSAELLREQLAESATPRDRVRIVESMLLARLRRSFDVKPALRLSLDAFEDPSLQSVAEVNRQTGLSPKRLTALYREQVGLSPKVYWRVRRFRRVLRDLEQGSLRGAALASLHGYCDQPHFLREFRAFAGSSLREYLAARIGGTDHVSVYG